MNSRADSSFPVRPVLAAPLSLAAPVRETLEASPVDFSKNRSASLRTNALSPSASNSKPSRTTLSRYGLATLPPGSERANSNRFVSTYWVPKPKVSATRRLAAGEVARHANLILAKRSHRLDPRCTRGRDAGRHERH